MRQRAGGRVRPFLLLGKQDDRDGVRVFRMRDFKEAMTLLSASLNEPFEMAGIRRWWGAQGGMMRRDDKALLADIARAEAAGIVAFAEPPQWKPRAAPGDPARRRPRPAAPPSKPARQRDRALPPRGRDTPDVPSKPDTPTQPDKTWIEFRLIDDDTNTPVANVPFRITLTDGSETTRSTNGAGKIRIDDIDPGTCGILKIEAEDAPVVTRVD